SGARKPDTTLPAAYEAPAGTAQLPNATLDRWWTIFGDDQLDALEDQALKLSPDAKTQMARLKEAIATRKSTILQTYPTGDLTGSASRQTAYSLAPSNSLFPVGGVTDTDQLNFNVSWEFDFLGALNDERRIARADFAATQFDVESARASLVANVADSYFVARGLAIQLDDANEQLRIEQQLLQVAQAKAEHGIGAQSDADRIAGDVAQSRSQVSNLQAQQHAAQRLLLILVGRGPEPVEHLPLAANVPDPPPLPEAVPGDLLIRRPDVREADLRMRAAALQTKLAKEELFPNITLKPALGLARQVAPGIGVASLVPLILIPQQQTTATSFWSYGANLDQPVLDIPRLLQDAKAQSARTEQAVVAYEQAVQNAYGDAENALVGLASDEERIKILEEGEARARRAYDAALIRYKAGLDDITSVLTVEQEWRSDRTALTGERVQALRRAVQTYKALGGGWDFQQTQTAARSP
ncbi:MAG TPA: efflux transporter outer membrane subunit, partial [Caulobacteraceae bacterium]|nr:efflux transporter outer membrane subunit [Caulobacteraceae bacterium]